jgi:hypothetical protein
MIAFRNKNRTEIPQLKNQDNIPVFFGHYWLRGNPMLYRGNICCLDYRIAKKGHLAAYRFDGESVLDAVKFVYV